MRLKLDENLGARGARIFKDAGHDVATVVEQGMTSAPDDELLAVCHAEQRALVTLDLDFSNPIVYPPQNYSGIAVIRLPARITPDDLHAACQVLVRALSHNDLAGKLWIVQRDRAREYRSDR